MKQKRVKQGKDPPTPPGFELQVTQCLVGATYIVPILGTWLYLLKDIEHTTPTQS